MKFNARAPFSVFAHRRSPHRERGLKSHCQTPLLRLLLSLPSQGAWIEIDGCVYVLKSSKSRSPHRERGLKFAIRQCIFRTRFRRSPHRERGLKFQVRFLFSVLLLSLPSQGAWIEMFLIHNFDKLRRRRSPHRERGLKLYFVTVSFRYYSRSPHRERGLK